MCSVWVPKGMLAEEQRDTGLREAPLGKRTAQMGTVEEPAEQEQPVALVAGERTPGERPDPLVVGAAEHIVAVVRIAAVEARTVVVGHIVAEVRTVGPVIVRTRSDTSTRPARPALSTVYRRALPPETACRASRRAYLLIEE